MVFRINKKTIASIIYILICIIPYFGSEWGIQIGSVKISIADFIVLGVFLNFLFKNSSKITFTKNRISIFYISWVVFIAWYIIMIPLGIINGATIWDSLRIIRNIIYIPSTFYILYKYAQNIESDILVMFIALIIMIDTLFNSWQLYINNNWFMFYRANGVLTVFLTLYLLLRIKYMKNMLKRFFSIFLCFGLIVASFLSQERLQIFILILSLLIVYIYSLFASSKWQGKNLIRNIATIFFFFIFLWSILHISFIRDYVDYYYTYRLQSGKIFAGGMSGDLSLMARAIQWKNIMSVNPLWLIIGRGSSSFYEAAQGMINSVDGTLLWIIKDLGLLGAIYFAAIYFKNFSYLKSISIVYKYPLLGCLICLGLFVLVNPTFLGSAYTGFVFGLFEFLLIKASKFSGIQKQ